MHARVVLGVGKGVLFREVSSFQRLKCMQEWYLGLEKVSGLERCPQFKSGVSCTYRTDVAVCFTVQGAEYALMMYSGSGTITSANLITVEGS